MENFKEIIASLSRLIGQTEESAREQSDFSGLTLTQMNYLETIRMLGNPNFTELAKVLRLSKPTVKVAIDKLVEKEFVSKVRSDKDRRSSHLHLTEKGELINRMHDQAHQNITDFLTSRLTGGEQEQLLQILKKALPE
jgi:DNA-binding MarR family transcriptional regulator